MLKKIFKLKSFEIKNIFEKNKENSPPKTLRSVFFNIKIKSLDLKIEQNTKFAVVISGKIFKKATIRNKTRRQIFSILENYQKEKMTLKNKQILFYPKKEIQDLEFLILEKEVYNSLNQLIK